MMRRHQRSSDSDLSPLSNSYSIFKKPAIREAIILPRDVGDPPERDSFYHAASFVYPFDIEPARDKSSSQESSTQGVVLILYISLLENYISDVSKDCSYYSYNYIYNYIFIRTSCIQDAPNLIASPLSSTSSLTNF